MATTVRRDAGEYIEDAWYAIADVGALRRGRATTVRRFGRDLALFRGADGRVSALASACPHRGADLGRGRVIDGVLQCPYHGFRFAPDGRCVGVPCEGGGFRIPDSLTAAAYPIVEAHGFIWLWWGAPREHYPPVFWPDDMPSKPSSRTASGSLDWDVSLPLTIESNLDIHHTPFAHRRVLPGLGTRLDPYEAQLDGDTIMSSGTLRRDDGRAWDGKSGLTFSLQCRFPAVVVGRFGATRFVAASAPIDATHTATLFRYFVDVPVIGGLLARLGVWSELRFVQPDDLAHQRAAARSHMPLHACGLVPSDRAIVLWYSLYRRRLAAQLGAPQDHEGGALLPPQYPWGAWIRHQQSLRQPRKTRS